MSALGFKNARVVRSSWLEEGGRRLDCNPYMSGALEARDALRRLKVRKDALHTITSGHAGGIFNGPVFSRVWVEDARYGVQFLGSSDVSTADLSTLPLLKRTYAQSKKLAHLRLTEGTTLITCSGTIGRMAYVRSDMAEIWSSQHIMKVVPDAARIPPGYLYAFLSSRYGVPLVVSGTYGAIIQHIEPEHIADLPVPRFDEGFEQQIASEIEQAAAQRTIAASKRKTALALFERRIGWSGFGDAPLVNKALASEVLRRLDAFHHSSKVNFSRTVLKKFRGICLEECVEQVFEPNRGSRLKVTDPDFGVPFLSSSSVFELNPCAEYLVSRSRTPNLENLLLTSRDVLLPRSGQLGGIIGRAVMPLPRSVGSAGSEHLVRVRCRSESDAAYLWAVLASEPGYWAVVGTAFGTSIPSLDAGLISDLYVPWLKDPERAEISELVQEAITAQDKGIAFEASALAKLEAKIQEGE